ncbi:MAG: hypothetical protein IJQ76_05975 [Prevotella sp.]|nr:hypothetical protein [Prevotella sp.]
MKKFYVFLAAMAGMTFVSCTNDDIVGENTVVSPNEETPIVFGSLKSGMTRADITGKDAADLLGNQFVVSGYKGSSTATVGNKVFDNYVVKYTENTANTTESNSTNWEYVGVDRIKHAIDNGITSQTIKYWDYSQPQYDFIAWSTGKKTAIYEKPSSGIPAGSVLVSAITPATLGTQAYTFEGKADDLKDCYIADLVTVKKAQYDKGPVTFKFRQLGTKVRIALYETVPGYSVKDVKFYSAAASDDASATAAKLFTTTANDIYTEGIYTVTFPTVDTPADADNNQAHVSFVGTGTQATTISWGAMNNNYTIAEEGEKTTGNVFLGRTSNTATFAGNAADNYYVVFLPNESGTNLNLRVNYTLESIDGSGETIEVKGATAQVPSIYTQWKPGFAYTYIFKISDKTNGYTGVYDPTKPDDTTVNSEPAGLYPITFDAVVENAEDNDATQETITLVSTPSITTYQQGSNVVNANEYTTIGTIYVTVNDGRTEGTPDLDHSTVQKLTGKAALYTIPAGKTEAEVVDALSMQDDDAATGTIKGRNGLVLTEAAMSLTGRVNYGVDDNPIIVGGDKVARFTPTANTTYAFVYTKKAATTNEEKFQPVSKTKGASVAGLYRYALKNAPAGDVKKGVTYFTASDKDMVSNIFLGQGVSNLYLDAAGNTIASGYAKTGTTYYYTTDNGMSYKAAHPVAYADFATAELYTEAAGVYTAKSDATPVDGTAYYYKETDNSYTYCVILPQQTNPAGGDRLKIVDETAAKILCTASKKAVVGMTYFDKYTKNDGVYYTKVIKVQ